MTPSYTILLTSPSPSPSPSCSHWKITGIIKPMRNQKRLSVHNAPSKCHHMSEGSALREALREALT